MITHDEARKAKLRLARHEHGGFQGAEYGRSYNVDNAIADSQLLDDYITQQEKKDKLLALYQSLYRHTNDDWLITKQQILAIERELL